MTLKHQNNYYVLRLAEIYLIVAENEINGPTQIEKMKSKYIWQDYI